MVVVVLIILLLVLSKYFNKAYRGKKKSIRTFWIYLSLMIIYIPVSEFHHFMAVLNYFQGNALQNLIDKSMNLFDSFIAIACILSILAVGFRIRSRFLRIYSLIFLAVVMGKILIIDMVLFDDIVKIVLYLIIGSITLVLSIFYPKFVRFFFTADSDDSFHTAQSGRMHSKQKGVDLQ
jgi:uncharacterized membrane protein